jgi:hypothetical protein
MQLDRWKEKPRKLFSPQLHPRMSDEKVDMPLPHVTWEPYYEAYKFFLGFTKGRYIRQKFDI